VYVPDDVTLGNPGIFGFISKAVSTVAKALTGEGGAIKVTVGPPPTPAAVPAPMPQFTLPGGGGISMATIGLIGGALLLGAMFSGRGKR
jgi:hypothetical protein